LTEVELAVVFGSPAREEAKPESDVNIATRGIVEI
jgi:predicted nucleotidyltransferase